MFGLRLIDLIDAGKSCKLMDTYAEMNAVEVNPWQSLFHPNVSLHRESGPYQYCKTDEPRPEAKPKFSEEPTLLLLIDKPNPNLSQFYDYGTVRMGSSQKG